VTQKATLARRTIERELRRVVAEKNLALFLKEQEVEDWLYGAEVALSWVLRQDTMAPAKAFGLKANAS